MVRFLKAGIVTTLFVFLFVAGLFPSPAQVLAAPAAVVTVSSAEGNAGETWIPSGYRVSQPWVWNISGGQFELVYDLNRPPWFRLKGSLLGIDACLCLTRIIRRIASRWPGLILPWNVGDGDIVILLLPCIKSILNQ